MGTTGTLFADLSRRSNGRIHTGRLSRPHGVRMVLTLATADVCAVGFAVGLAVMLRGALNPSLDPQVYLGLLPLLIIFPAVLAGFGLYPGIALHPVSEIASIARGVTTSFLLLMAASFLIRDVEQYSRAVLLLSWPAAVISVCCMRFVARRAVGRSAWWGREAVILGAGPLAARLAAHLTRCPGLGLRLVGMLEHGAEQGSKQNLLVPVIGGIADAPVIAERLNVRYALVAVSTVERAELARLIERYTACFHHIYVIPDLPGLSSLGVHAHDLGGMLGVEISHRLLFRTPQAVKRSFDILAAFTALAVLAPFMLLVAILIKSRGKGPAFYSQARRGRQGRPFRAWKFRTMVVDADRILADSLRASPELCAEWERDHKLKRDPRVTPIGRFLRKTSLDELPQLWNVLRGEMSLVGPRPIVDEEIPRYGAKYSLYKQVRPGISGLWQISGRNNTTYDERVGFDEYYVRNWSPWLDLYILGRTVEVVMTGDGAY